MNELESTEQKTTQQQPRTRFHRQHETQLWVLGFYHLKSPPIIWKYLSSLGICDEVIKLENNVSFKNHTK